MWRNRDEPLIAAAAASTENPSPTGMWTVSVLAAMAAHRVCHPRKPSPPVKATWVMVVAPFADRPPHSAELAPEPLRSWPWSSGSLSWIILLSGRSEYRRPSTKRHRSEVIGDVRVALATLAPRRR